MHHNAIGISAGGGPVLNNQVYANAVGISGGGLIQGNRIYSNATGVVFRNSGTLNLLINNVVWANSSVGVDVGGTGLPTAQQHHLSPGRRRRAPGWLRRASMETAPISRCATTSSGRRRATTWSCRPRTKSASPATTTSSTPRAPAILATWQGHDFSDLVTWFYETGQDMHSLSADPQFVNAAGADGLLGYDPLRNVDHSADDDFHLLAGSPGVDRGDPGDLLCSGADTQRRPHRHRRLWQYAASHPKPCPGRPECSGRIPCGGFKSAGKSPSPGRAMA